MNKMIKQWVSGATIVATLATGQAVFAAGAEYGKGDPKHPISLPTWPAGVSALANRTDRISGHRVNGSSWFLYRGDATAFNDFLQQFAQVKTTPLGLYIGDMDDLVVAKSSTGLPPNCDWNLSATGWYGTNVSVTLPHDSSVPLKDIKIPANFVVTFIGTKTPEVDALLAKHKAEYDKFNSKNKPKIKDNKVIRLF